MSNAKLLASEDDVMVSTFAVSSSIVVDDVGNASRRRFRGSDCSGSDLPKQAQAILGKIVWNDAFFEHNADNVLAVFDINVKTIKETLKAQLLVLSIAFLPSIVLGVVVTIHGGFIGGIVFGCLLALFVHEIAASAKELNMTDRRHVAVTTDGVFLGVSDEADPSQLTQRQVIKFEDIKSCHVSETGCFRPSFQVSIVLKRPTTITGEISISGLCNGQAFVDLVTAMMESIPETSPVATTEHLRAQQRQRSLMKKAADSKQ